MKLRRVMDGAVPAVQVAIAGGWVDVARALQGTQFATDAERALWCTDAIALLGAPAAVHRDMLERAARISPLTDDARVPVLPFAPRSFRDFMLYERHAIDAARGFVRTYMPRAWPLVRAWEATVGPPFPLLKPHALWSRQPIYYMGNHLAFAGDGDMSIPAYTQALDYELELGFVLSRDLMDASPAEAEAAIGGFVVVNDFSARDVQHAEMRSGFGPQKAKHFRNGLSAEIVSADEILPRWRDLTGFVRLNGELIAEPQTAGGRWSLGEAVAHVSRSERLFPGELFATGTLPGGSGIERGRLLEAGDEIEIGITGVGTLRNRIVAPARGS
ncbi:fumarylacetoacetate hydrolase family protein [Hyphomicrobium sp.]|uniref:fumarylacetoacetate hydrolase family protein n=1 Tax=Hyphomicrobium sp. TaxID=82 RepID=UPI003F6F0370